MNRKRIERLIPEAMSELQRLVEENGKISKVYDSYIAAFGPSVITSGLLMTTMFYEGDDKKKKITRIFWNLLKKERDTGDTKKLVEYIKKNPTDPTLRSCMLDIAVACKLAVRTFELDKSIED